MSHKEETDINSMARRLSLILSEAYRYLDEEFNSGDTYRVLIAFMRYCPPLVDWLVFQRVTNGLTIETDSDIGKLLIKLADTIDKMDGTTELVQAAQILHTDVLPMGKAVARKTKVKSEMLVTEEIKKLQGKKTIAEQEYKAYEVPQFKIECLAEDGEVYYAENQFLQGKTVGELCEITCARIWRMYGGMIDRLEPLVKEQMRIDFYQQRFGQNSGLIQSVLKKEPA